MIDHKVVKKAYFDVISHDDSLVYYNLHRGLGLVKEILTIRWNRMATGQVCSIEDLYALIFIAKHEEELKIALKL